MSKEFFRERFIDAPLNLWARSNELEHVLVLDGHGNAFILVNQVPDAIKTMEDVYSHEYFVVSSRDGIEPLIRLLSTESEKEIV